MAKPMLEISPGPAERDLPYIQWVIQAVLPDSSLDIVIAKTEDDVFIVGGAWVVTVVELESSTVGTRIWK